MGWENGEVRVNLDDRGRAALAMIALDHSYMAYRDPDGVITLVPIRAQEDVINPTILAAVEDSLAHPERFVKRGRPKGQEG